MLSPNPYFQSSAQSNVGDDYTGLTLNISVSAGSSMKPPFYVVHLIGKRTYNNETDEQKELFV